MKESTKRIYDLLNSNKINKYMENIASDQSSEVHGENDGKSASNRFFYLKDVLLKSVDNGDLDEISYTRRINIESALSNMDPHYNSFRQICMSVENIYDQTISAGLHNMSKESRKYQDELKELGKLKRSYNQFIKKFELSKDQLEFIQRSKAELDQALEKGSKTNNTIEELEKNSKSSNEEILRELANAENLIRDLEKAKKEVEETKLGINTFSKNIDEYKGEIKKITDAASGAIEKEEKINQLIESAGEALNLNTALGISAAFAAQSAEANDEKHAKKWIRYAAILIVLALGLTVWIVGGGELKILMR